MEQKRRRDLTISGIMGGQGGTYHSVNLNGVGKVNGHLDCIHFHCHGRVKIQGDVKVEQMAEIHGDARIAGNLESGKLKVHGKTNVGGYVSGEEIEIHGFLKVNSHCEAESFCARGGFRINGLLNAGTIDIQLYAPCEAKEIGGETIRIQKPGAVSPFSKFIRSILPRIDVLTVETIEGDDIHLEYTRAKVVRGTNVTIGPGCIIDMVEYRQHFDQDKNAKVLESKRV
ncbi:polymer-forming cytoskeletal protein [Thermoflavimicrobium dichotomicum]|uniref:Polymer-forming protein n=1 Tax=Thermoflavimicrobium dichotomicum TaxID=46223 RepID=A0A1I3TP98_9BACL|nr:polymer-forming cytoskeletal protein [Thermoflavimicrobium dichotomicum]SFJ71466.1 Polymer-forming protein [Thermoflavimicrobium dichotomicum]